MQANCSEYIRSGSRRPSPQRAIATVAVLVVGTVGISACGTLPLTVERGVQLPTDTAAVPAGGDNSPAKKYSLIRTEPVALSLKTSGSSAAPSPTPRTTDYPNLLNALSRVPVRMKLQVLLTLLTAEADPADRLRFETKLKALLKLPDDVLVEVLAHPDLTDFNAMLDAVFFGDTELWWVEAQLAKIDIVPVAPTVDRIYVSGKPAYSFDSTAAAHGVSSGGSSTSGLKSLQPQPKAPSEPEASTMVARSMPAPDVNTFVAPAPIEQAAFSISATEMTVMQAPSSPDPAPPPAPAPPPPPPGTNLELSQVHTETTLTPDVFDTGNSFEPGSFVSSTPTNNPELSIETPAPPSAAPPPAADEGTPGDTTPGGNEDHGDPPAGDPSP